MCALARGHAASVLAACVASRARLWLRGRSDYGNGHILRVTVRCKGRWRRFHAQGRGARRARMRDNTFACGARPARVAPFDTFERPRSRDAARWAHGQRALARGPPSRPLTSFWVLYPCLSRGPRAWAGRCTREATMKARSHPWQRRFRAFQSTKAITPGCERSIGRFQTLRLGRKKKLWTARPCKKRSLLRWGTLTSIGVDGGWMTVMTVTQIRA